ncbi:MAG TPA: hypothetical protein VIV57_04400 [Anaeromyxobacter sp.]
MRPLALVLAAAVASVGSAKASPSVTLNGVPIDGVTSQKFENCTVVIDAQGNIHIEAKGYAVRGGPAGAAPSGRGDPPPAASKAPATAEARPGPPAKLTRRYFLATDHGAPGTQFDLAIFVNAQWIREVKAAEPQAVMEITKYMRPGSNKVTLVATKRIQGGRLSYSKDVQLKVVIGEGNVGGDHVMIDVPLVETARTAAEIEDKTEEFVVEAR